MVMIPKHKGFNDIIKGNSSAKCRNKRAQMKWIHKAVQPGGNSQLYHSATSLHIHFFLRPLHAVNFAEQKLKKRGDAGLMLWKRICIFRCIWIFANVMHIKNVARRPLQTSNNATSDPKRLYYWANLHVLHTKMQMCCILKRANI